MSAAPLGAQDLELRPVRFAAAAVDDDFANELFDDFTPSYCNPANFSEKDAQIVFPHTSDFGRRIPPSEQRWISGLNGTDGNPLSDAQFFRWLWFVDGRHNFRIIGPGYGSNEMVLVIDPPDPTADYTVRLAQLIPTTESCRTGAAERPKRALYLEAVGFGFQHITGFCPGGSVCVTVTLYDFESSISLRGRGAGWNGYSYSETTGSGGRGRRWSYPIRSGVRSSPTILLVQRGSTYISTLHFGGGLDYGTYQIRGLERAGRASIGRGDRILHVSAEYWHPNENRWKWAQWIRPEEHSRDFNRNYVGQFGIADFFGPSNPELFVKTNDLCAFTGGVHAGVAAATTLDLNVIVKDEGGKSLQLAAPGGTGFAAYTGGFDLCAADQ